MARRRRGIHWHLLYHNGGIAREIHGYFQVAKEHITIHSAGHATIFFSGETLIRKRVHVIFYKRC